MDSISVREAREHMARVLERVRAGEEIMILRHGKPVARLIQPASESVSFRSRAALRDELPPMQETAKRTVRQMRDAERF